jgi:hypothetical protein
MTEPDATRPQDAGRSHHRKGAPSAATRSLLADYQAAMRDELRAILDELRPVAPDPGLGLVAMPAKRPELNQRTRLWDLGIKLGRELGTAVDVEPADAGAVTQGPRKRSRAKIDYGPDR